jgi:hypothetical protein
MRRQFLTLARITRLSEVANGSEIGHQIGHLLGS